MGGAPGEASCLLPFDSSRGGPLDVLALFDDNVLIKRPGLVQPLALSGRAVHLSVCSTQCAALILGETYSSHSVSQASVLHP